MDPDADVAGYAVNDGSAGASTHALPHALRDATAGPTRGRSRRLSDSRCDGANQEESRVQNPELRIEEEHPQITQMTQMRRKSDVR